VCARRGGDDTAACAYTSRGAAPPVEAASRSARKADTHLGHAQTPMAGRSTAAHGGGAAATCGVARARRCVERVLSPVHSVCPCLCVRSSKFYVYTSKLIDRKFVDELIL
jgi:hypothetical protein